ncbi:MAG: hypothetical protein FJ104_07610, partial [Deltaproteobacteria bacterium]|nr:hypothetical protein [Deltaproteobacteria bacterium]
VEWVSRVDRSGPPADVLRRSFAAYFEFVTQDRTTFELLRRNPHTVRAFAKDSTLSDERARLSGILSEDIAAGRMPRVDVEFVAAAMIGAAFEVALCLVERDPPDVEAATRFASDLFIGFFQRTARRDASLSGGRP